MKSFILLLLVPTLLHGASVTDQKGVDQLFQVLKAVDITSTEDSDAVDIASTEDSDSLDIASTEDSDAEFDVRQASTDDCLEAIFTQAKVKQENIDVYVQEFRVGKTDPTVFVGKDLIVVLLRLRSLGISDDSDAISLFNCVNRPGTPCSQQPFCQNGGSCVHVNAIREHVCTCPELFEGGRCERKKQDRVEKVRTSFTALQDQRKGATYTRWGRTTCNEDVGSELIYNGFMGGPHYSHKGGGAAYLCLPQEAIYDRFRAGHNSQGLIYVSEFETSSSFSPFSGFNNHNPRCAICQAGDGRRAQLVIPARNECPDRWTLEYKGYLMTEQYSYRRTEYVCVDDQPEVVPNTQANNNGALLHFVEAVCSSEMPCADRGNYDKNKELTCAVCTR